VHVDPAAGSKTVARAPIALSALFAGEREFVASDYAARRM